MRRSYIYSLAVSSGVCSAVAVLQLFSVNTLNLFPHGLSYYDAHTAYTGEFLGTIGNTNLLAAFLCLSIPLLSVTFIEGNSKRDSLLLLPAAFCFLILIASRVAGGAVGIIVCALAAAPLLLSTLRRLRRAAVLLAAFSVAVGLVASFSPSYVNRIFSFSFHPGKISSAFFILGLLLLFAAAFLGNAEKRRSIGPSALRKGILIFEAALITASLAVFYFYPFESPGTVYELHRVLHGELEDSFGSSRILIWRKSLALFRESPLFGGGPGTLSQRVNILFSRYVPETGRTLTAAVDNTHNEYIGLLINTGLTSLAAYLFAITISIKKWTKGRFSPFIPAIGSALVCYWTDAAFGLALSVVSPVMWVLWGLFFAAKRADQ